MTLTDLTPDHAGAAHDAAYRLRTMTPHEQRCIARHGGHAAATPTTQLDLFAAPDTAPGPRPLTDAELENDWRRRTGTQYRADVTPDLDAVRADSERENQRMYRVGYQDGMRAYPDNDPDELAYGLTFYARRAAMKHSAYEQGIYDALWARTQETTR